jgi:hypothetical protein
MPIRIIEKKKNDDWRNSSSAHSRYMALHSGKIFKKIRGQDI